MTDVGTAIFEVFEIALAVLLVVAAGAKLADFRSFVSAVEGLGVKSSFSTGVAGLSIVIEFAVASAVAVPATVSFGPIAMALLYDAFAAITVYAVWRRPGLSCSCFGRLAQTQFTPRARLRALVLAAVASSLAVAANVGGADLEGGSPLAGAFAAWMLALLAAVSLSASSALGVVASWVRSD